jgi:hypothetical protein
MPDDKPDLPHTETGSGFRLASRRGMAFAGCRMSLLPTADLLALDTTGLKSRLSKLRRYL